MSGREEGGLGEREDEGSVPGSAGGLWCRIRQKRRPLNIILPLVAIGLEVFYSICGGACSYLRGELAGIDLQYVGIAFMVLLIVLTLLRRDLVLLAALSAGFGVELYLIGFQVWYNTYCPYCLAFGGILVVQLMLNMDFRKWKLASVTALASLLVFAWLFEGSMSPVYANEPLVPTFGRGKVTVRLYTDYFCPPCRSMEPKLEPILEDLIHRNVITLTFVDTPIYRYSSLYARYFLYILNEKKDFQRTLLARAVLIGAALDKIHDQDKLEEYLKKRGIGFKAFDVKPTQAILNQYLRENRINSTPTCVIYAGVKADTYVGGADIIAALEKIQKESTKTSWSD